MRATAALATLGAVILGLASAPARAESTEAEDPRQPRRHRSAEILLDMDDAVRSERDEAGDFRIRKRYGFEYSHSIRQDERPPLVFSVQGPVVPRKKLGITFEIRF